MLHIKNGSKSNTNSQLQKNFHQEFELFIKYEIYANNGGHYNYKIVRLIKNFPFVHIRPYNFKK